MSRTWFHRADTLTDQELHNSVDRIPERPEREPQRALSERQGGGIYGLYTGRLQ